MQLSRMAYLAGVPLTLFLMMLGVWPSPLTLVGLFVLPAPFLCVYCALRRVPTVPRLLSAYVVVAMTTSALGIAFYFLWQYV